MAAEALPPQMHSLRNYLKNAHCMNYFILSRLRGIFTDLNFQTLPNIGHFFLKKSFFSQKNDLFEENGL